MKLTKNELAICDNGLDMERLLKKKRRARRMQRNKSRTSRKLKKAKMFGIRTGLNGKYDDEYEHILYLSWISMKKSKERKYLKTFSNKMIRKTPFETFGGKGSKHKRITEYWWIVY